MQTRQTTTKNDIKQALTILLKDKRLEDISISQLTKKAGINRSTFYLHYLDKADLLEQLKEDTEGHIQEILTGGMANPSQALEDVLTYLHQDISFFSRMAAQPQFDFTDSVKQFILGVIDGNMGARREIAAAYHMPENFAVTMLSSGMAGIIVEWIMGKVQGSPQELTAILLQTPGLTWFKGEE